MRFLSGVWPGFVVLSSVGAHLRLAPTDERPQLRKGQRSRAMLERLATQAPATQALLFRVPRGSSLQFSMTSSSSPARHSLACSEAKGQVASPPFVRSMVPHAVLELIRFATAAPNCPVALSREAGVTRLAGPLFALRCVSKRTDHQQILLEKLRLKLPSKIIQKKM
jgi:hypothetical protein